MNLVQRYNESLINPIFIVGGLDWAADATGPTTDWAADAAAGWADSTQAVAPTSSW